MIVAQNLTKSFGDIKAVDNISAEIQKGSVYGLVGSNGAGKSTFLRMLSGIYLPDHGNITIEGRDPFYDTALKSKCFFISDEQYFFSNATPDDMKKYYKSLYPLFDERTYKNLCESFALPNGRHINTFSKGMKKQLSVILGVSSMTEYIFCDETFDGLDPVARQAVKGIFAATVAERGLTPVIASHNLRELEDICDHVGLLHRGGILFNRDLEDMKTGIHKIQCVLREAPDDNTFSALEVISKDTRGSLITIIARGAREDIERALSVLNPIFCELLPLSLEEIFITETEVKGYDIKKLIL